MGRRFLYGQFISIYHSIDNNMKVGFSSVSQSILNIATSGRFVVYRYCISMGPHPRAASMLFLPMIDMNPGNLNCIFSTQQFLCNHACHYNVKPIITFDEPLWLKSHQVIGSQPEGSEFHDIIQQLGEFHTLMSFLGCRGHIMAVSGLQVCAANTVKHMLTGKA